MIKKIFIIILFIISTPIFQTYSYNGNDIHGHFVSINAGDDYTETIPEGKDFFLNGITILDATSSIEITLEDGIDLIYQRTITNGDVIDINTVFYDELILTNLDSVKNLDFFYNGYYLNEGDIIELKSIKDYQELVIGILQGDNAMIIFSLIGVWFMLIGLLYLNIMWGFKAGVLLFKKHNLAKGKK